jgi:macrolide-specific efflux system membrane fusion protein
LIVAGQFAEADAALLAVNQPTTVFFPTLGEASSQGTVTGISPSATVADALVTYRVTVTLDTPPENVRLGQSANVVITTASKDNALYLPANAVTVTSLEATEGTVLLLAEDNAVSEVTVGIGMQGSATVEITEGLAEGQVVLVVTDTSGIRDTVNLRLGSLEQPQARAATPVAVQ